MKTHKPTEDHKKISAKMRGLTIRVFNNCKNEPGKPGFLAMKHQLEYLKDRLLAKLPVPELTHAQTVQCYKNGIDKFLNK